MAATPAPAHAAEIKLLGPASFRVLFPKLLPQFEESSGDTVTAGYAPLGVITERVIKGEAVDVAIVSGEAGQAACGEPGGNRPSWLHRFR